MDCASCGKTNRAAARFCSGCGSALAPRCPSCGAEHDTGARFCDSCGASLAGNDGSITAPDTETRRVVTVVFADLIGSTTLHERIDAESARRVMASYYAALSAAVEVHDGTVIKLLGDGVLAGFGVSRVQEDDAVRAVRAAVAMHDAMHGLAAEFGELAGELGLRVGVNTGEVVVSDQDDDVVGDPVNVAARLQQEARDGEVLIGDATRRLVDDVLTLEAAGVFALKGRTGTVAAHRVVSLERPATGPTTSFVGRDDELRRVLGTYATAAAGREARLVIMVGSPGLGKSRLMDEVSRRLVGEASILTARCDVSGGPTFTPIADAIRAFVAVDSDDQTIDAVRGGFEALIGEDEPERDRIVHGAVALCTGEPGPPEETFWVVRRVLAALGRERPVVLAIDDLHWAEPLLLDLVEHLVEWSTDVPLVVLGAARPELRDTRSSLTTAGGVADEVIALDGLDAGAATRLAADTIGAAELPAAVAGRVLAASEGNPLFLGALVRMLVDDGALEWDGERWIATVELDELEMPPTIHALLAARIDRLDPVVRLVLERASVIGRQFSREAVAYLLPPDLHAELDGTFEALRRSELIEPDDTWFLGEPAMRFHHALIRDAAYRRLLKDARADLHASFAEWLEQRVGDGIEQDEAIGSHFEQAYRHLVELGPLDERAQSLGTRAAERLAAEGRRALARDDLTVAAGLLGRAVSLLATDDPHRAELSLDWCEALLAGGDVNDAPNAIDELGRWAESSERLQAWRTSFVGHLAVLTDPQRLRETADAVAAAAATLAALEDAAGEAKAHSVRALALARLGEVGACETALDQALVAARRADDRRRSNAVLAGAPVAALWGPSPVTRASGRCLDVVRVLRITAAAPAVEAVAMRCQAVLEALRGRGDAARRMITSSRRTVESLGLTIRILEADMAAGLIELINGEPAAAESLLRPTYRGFRDRGLGVDAAQAGALLGRSLLALGRVSEAEAISHECEELAGHDLKAAIAWRGVRAEALARRGQYSDAIGFARDAVAIAAGTDALLDHADARVALAVALRVAGKHTEAEAELAAAFDLWSAKGATALLTGGSEPEQPVETAAPVAVRPNRATENADRMDAAVECGDLDAVADTLATDFEYRYHPLELSGDRDALVESWRVVFEEASATVERDDIATMGDDLALFRWRTRIEAIGDAEATFGEAELDQFVLIEVDVDGRRRWSEVFAPDDLSHARARLEERAEREPGARSNRASRAVAAMHRSWHDRDWDSVKALFSPTFELDDRRPLVGMKLSRDPYLTNLELVYAASTVTIETVEIGGPNAMLIRLHIEGDRPDVAPQFVEEQLSVIEVDGLGRFVAFVVFPLADMDAAQRELVSRLSRGRSATETNLATRSTEAFVAAMHARDMNAVDALVAPDFVGVDRRPVFHDVSDREKHLDILRLTHELESFEFTGEALAIRGETMVLLQVHFASTDPSFGATEIDYLQVVEVDPDGRQVGIVTLEIEDFDAANAELDRCYAQSTNSAFAALLESERRWREDDWDGVLELYDADAYVLDDRRSLMHVRTSGGQFVENLRFLFDDGAFTSTFLEGRGDRLALVRAEYTSTRAGAFFSEHYRVVETGADGRLIAMAIFEIDDIDRATAELDMRFARSQRRNQTGENSAVRVLAQVGDAIEARDLDLAERLLALKFRAISHRSLFQHDSDREAYLALLRVVMEIESFTSATMVLETRGDRLALSRLVFRGELTFGGEGEIEWLQVTEVDDEGRCTLMVTYDPDELDAAHAELDRLYGEGKSGPARTAVIRVLEQLGEAFDVGDWERFEALSSPAIVMDDRRSMSQLRGDLSTWIESSKLLAEADATEVATHLSVLGEGLLLDRILWTSARESSRFEVDALRVSQLDDDGRLVAVVIFDPGDRLAANDELWRRSALTAEGQQIPAVIYESGRAFNRHDMKAVRATLRHDFVFDDHRRTGIGALDIDTYMDSLAALFAETDGLIGEIRHRVAFGRWGTLSVGNSVGTIKGGGDFENLFVRLFMTDGHLLTRIEIFELDDLEVAKRRYQALNDELEQGRAGLPMPSNAASLASDRTFVAFYAADWSAVEALTAPGFAYRDHRNGVHTDFDTQQWLESMRLMAASNARAERQQLSVLGERLALEWVRWTGRSEEPGADGAEFEVEILRVVEADDHGLLVSVSAYDPHDRRAANAELWRLYEASEEGRRIPTSIYRNLEAFNHHDLAALRATLREDFVFDDRRRTGSGALGPDAYVESIAVLLGETDDLIGETLYRVATNAVGTLSVGHIVGTTNHGGDFENLFVRLIMTDGELLTRIEIFEPDDLPVAQARFAELSPSSGYALTNKATRTVDRWEAALVAKDRATLHSILTPEFTFEDRGRMIRVVGRHAEFEKSNELIMSQSVQLERHVVSVLGDCLDLERKKWSGESMDADFTIERLTVHEVNGDGHLVAVVTFDAEDRSAAYDELWSRFDARGEGQFRAPVREQARRAFNRHDLPALRAALADDFVFEDRRKTSIGFLSADEYVDSVAALAEESGSFANETLYLVAHQPWGGVDMTRIAGTTKDGAPFENLFVRCTATDGSKIAVIAIFEPEEVERAVARLDELRPKQDVPPVSMSNAATRALDRTEALYEARRWDELEAAVSPALVVEDRRALARVTTDRPGWLRSIRLLAEANATQRRTPLSLLGDGLAMHTSSWSAEFDGASIDGEAIGVAEVDADGRLVAVVHFDAADRKEANAELWKRFRESADGRVLPPAGFDAVDAVIRRDVAGFRSTLADDFTFVDHRPLGSDSMGPDEYVEFLEALIAETSDFLYESVRTLAMSRAGGVEVVRLFGHTVDGAAFEFVFVRVTLANSRGLTAMEAFPLEDEAAALARFGELEQQARSTMNFDDLEVFRSMLAEECVLVDHRPLAAEPMDRDAYVAYFAALLEETSEVNYERLEVLAESPEGMVELARLTGHSRDGVEFENVFLRVAVLRDGLFVVMEIFPPEDRDAAFARFEELQADPARRGGTQPSENKATDALDRAQRSYEGRDWETLKATASPDFLFSDRRHLAQVTSDRDGWIHSSKLMASASAEEDRTILSVLGDRLALYQSLWTAQVEGAPLVVESLGLCEVDADGQFVELLHFDLEQRRAASDELYERFRRSDEGQLLPAVIFEALHALNHGDGEGFRGLLDDAFRYVDHRPLGAQSMGPDQYVEFMRALVDEASDYVYETVRDLRRARTGWVAISRLRGHTTDGGEFADEYVRLSVAKAGRVISLEVFPMDQVDAALARFEELSNPE